MKCISEKTILRLIFIFALCGALFFIVNNFVIQQNK